VALLRTCQPESRQLVKQALDTLLPSLPIRLPLKAGDSKVPIWIRYTKKVLVEEGHSMAHLTHIFQLLVRHSSLFFPSRAQFVPQMVNSLSRLGLPQNTPPESRKLAIDLAGLVVQWEKRRLEEAENPPPPVAGAPQNPEGVSEMEVDHPGSGGKRTSSGAGFEDEDSVKRLKGEGGATLQVENMGGGGPQTPGPATPQAATPSGPPEEEFRPSPAMEDMIISFLTRVCFLTEPTKDKEHKTMYNRSLDLLGQVSALLHLCREC
jgi:transformation/transcription domain-associated protein